VSQNFQAILMKFNEKYANDEKFAQLVRTDYQTALKECGLDIEKHSVRFELKIDDETVQHFVLPSFKDSDMYDEEMQQIHAAKRMKDANGGYNEVAASSMGCFPSTVSSDDVGNTRKLNYKVDQWGNRV
jgi:hypothetical protein